MEKDLSFLTEKQRTVYLLKQEGKTYKAIAKELNISYNGVRNHYLLAERRIRAHNEYINAIQSRSKKYIDVNMNIVELRLIIHALMDRNMSMLDKIHYSVKSSWFEKLPYEYTVIENLLERLNKIYTKKIDEERKEEKIE